MADGIDALMHAVQTPRRDPLVQDPRVQAQPDKLKKRNHPMLPRRQLGERPVRSTEDHSPTGRFSSI
jgi:hypothetical protein